MPCASTVRSMLSRQFSKGAPGSASAVDCEFRRGGGGDDNDDDEGGGGGGDGSGGGGDDEDVSMLSRQFSKGAPGSASVVECDHRHRDQASVVPIP